MVALVALVGYLVPDMEKMISLTGGLHDTPIGRVHLIFCMASEGSRAQATPPPPVLPAPLECVRSRVSSHVSAGSVAFSAIGFVLPGLFYLKLQPESAPFSPTSASTVARCVLPRPLLNNVAALTMVLVGMVGAVWGVISAVG